MIRDVLRVLTTPVRRAALRLAVALAPKGEVHAVELRDWTVMGGTAARFGRVREALDLLAEFAPRWLRGVRRDLRRIVIAKGDVGYYSVDLGACVIGTSYLERCTTAQLALVLVHEATHARLRRAGVRTTSSNRARIERACIKAEAAFAAKLPEAKELLEAIVNKASTDWWTAPERGKRLAASAKAYGAPAWLARMVEQLPSHRDRPAR